MANRLENKCVAAAVLRSQSSRSKYFCVMLRIYSTLSLPLSLTLHGVLLHLSMMLCLFNTRCLCDSEECGRLRATMSSQALWMRTHYITQHVNAVHLAQCRTGCIVTGCAPRLEHSPATGLPLCPPQLKPVPHLWITLDGDKCRHKLMVAESTFKHSFVSLFMVSP